MKSIAVTAMKGGTGKTAISVTLAQYAALRRNQRVLFIDTDGQGNSSHTIRKLDAVTVSHRSASHIFTKASLPVESSPFTLLQADTAGLRVLEQRSDKRNEYATNFRANITALAHQFDLCVIDSAPSSDIRLLSVLVSVNAAISPLQLNQEAVSGMGALMNDPQTGIRSIQAKLNPGLKFLGFLPNLVVQTKFQKDNLAGLLTHGLGLMFVSNEGQPMMIKQSTAVAEAMASGQPIFQSTKSTSRDAWKQMQPVFDEILDRVTESDNA